MRTIKELLEVMLKHQEFFTGGLCRWSANLYDEGIISQGELHFLALYIKCNKPSFLTKGRLFCDPYYWKVNQISFRITWINKQIKKLENENKSTN